jgi:hypothetical protein
MSERPNVKTAGGLKEGSPQATGRAGERRRNPPPGGSIPGHLSGAAGACLAQLHSSLTGSTGPAGTVSSVSTKTV